MKKSELIAKAKEHLAPGKYLYVCSALREVANQATGIAEHEMLNEMVDDLQNWILRDLLQRYAFYNQWLAAKHPEIYNKSPASPFREARLQWMDWMIEYWKEKGD